jgi:hypothetical protein
MVQPVVDLFAVVDLLVSVSFLLDMNTGLKLYHPYQKSYFFACFFKLRLLANEL